MKILSIESIPFHEIQYLSSGRQGIPRHCVLPFYRVFMNNLPSGVNAFAATSDLQGRERAKTNRLLGEQVSDELKTLSEIGDIPKLSGIILAGDLYDYPNLRKLGGTGDVTSVWNQFASDFDEVVGVHGNHDTIVDEELKGNTIILDGNNVNCFGINIAGISGIIGNPNRNQRKSSAKYQIALHNVIQKNPDILVTHMGPNNPYTQDKGEPLIYDLLENTGNGLMLFGHCYWQQPFIEIGNWQVLNLDSRVFVFCPKAE